MEEEQDQVSQMYYCCMGLYIDGMNIQSSSKFSCDEPILNYEMKLFHDLENYIENLEQHSIRLKCAGHFHVQISMAVLVEPMKEQ